MEADIPDYDMDSDDELWVNSQSPKLELTADKFEEMMDRLEKGSGQTVVTLQEAKALIKEDDDLIIAVYDYWLNKRLKTQHPLISQVRTEARFGVSNHNPYIAFRRRTEKMQTRKNRKNDESSYEKMLKLKRDLSRAVTLLEMVKRREKSKRELLHLSIEVFEKRYQLGDFTGQLVAEALSQRPVRPVFSPLLQSNHLSWLKDPAFASITRKEKRHYKKRRHKSSSKGVNVPAGFLTDLSINQSFAFAREHISEEDVTLERNPSDVDDEEEEGEYSFRRKANCSYHPVQNTGSYYWCSSDDQVLKKRFRFYPASVSRNNRRKGRRFLGFCRRRLGRGGRVLLDRASYSSRDEFFQLIKSGDPQAEPESVHSNEPNQCITESQWVEKTMAAPDQDSCWHFRPKTPTESLELDPEYSDIEILGASSSNRNLGSTDAIRTPLTFGNYLSTIVSTDEDPFVIDVNTLVNEPDPHSMCRPAYLTDAVEQSSCDTHLFNNELNDFTALCEGESEFADTYFTEDILENELLNTLPTSFEENSSTFVHRTEQYSFGASSDFLPNSNTSSQTENFMSFNDGLTDNYEQRAVEENMCLYTASNRRTSVDKDDKENDRVIISAHTIENLPVIEETRTDNSPNVVVNGDTTGTSSEECIPVEEQKSNFVLPPKQWICNCIT